MSIRTVQSFVVFVAAAILLPSAVAQTSPANNQAQVAELQQVENAWDLAVNKRDQYGLENVLSPQLVDIAATGDVTTRNQDLAKLYTKGAVPESMAQKAITVRSLNDGFVLVNGTYTMRWPETLDASKTGVIEEKGIFTQVFQASNGRWACVSSQRTVIAEEMPQTKTKTAAPRAKSNAVEPFHIPLFHKGAESTQPAPAQSPAAPPNP